MTPLKHLPLRQRANALDYFKKFIWVTHFITWLLSFFESIRITLLFLKNDLFRFFVSNLTLVTTSKCQGCLLFPPFSVQCFGCPSVPHQLHTCTPGSAGSPFPPSIRASSQNSLPQESEVTELGCGFLKTGLVASRNKAVCFEGCFCLNC